MPRSRRSYAYLISCRLGDAMADSVLCAFDCSYAQGEGELDRSLTKAKLYLTRRYDMNLDKVAEKIGDLYDELDEKKGDYHGLSCIIDNSRNIAFRTILEDQHFDADLVQVKLGDKLKETAAETIVEREYLISNLAVEMARRTVAIEPNGDISVSEIVESLEGAQSRPTGRHMDITVPTETDPRDDIALCLGLGVLWASYMPPESENWQMHQKKSFGAKQSYDWVV